MEIQQQQHPASRQSGRRESPQTHACRRAAAPARRRAVGERRVDVLRIRATAPPPEEKEDEQHEEAAPSQGLARLERWRPGSAPASGTAKFRRASHRLTGTPLPVSPRAGASGTTTTDTPLPACRRHLHRWPPRAAPPAGRRTPPSFYNHPHSPCSRHLTPEATESPEAHPPNPTTTPAAPPDQRMASDATAAATVDGSALAGRALAAAGTRHMFGVVGIPVTSLASRAAAAGVRFLAFRNEQSAGYAAAAYGFLTGSPGVLLTVSGPGCVHGLAGLSHATANAWPLLMVSGSCNQADAGRGDFQELDQVAATKPFAKLVVKATTIADIPRLLFQALAAAVSGRPGGCYLDIPSDVLHQTLTESEAAALIAAAADSAASDPSLTKHKSLDEGVEKAADLLRRAERPLVVIGKGAAYARAEEAIRKLVDTTGIPFLPTPMGKGVVPDSHPLSATAARSLAIGQCDVALVVGARLNWLLHFGEPPKWSKDVKFILVDVCEEEIELRKPCVGIVGDAKRVIQLINREIKDNPFCLARSHPWVEAITKKANDNVLKMEAQLAKDVVPFNFMTPLRIIRDAILAEGSPAPVVVSEGANTMDVGRAVLVQNEPRTRLDAGTWGTMGVGLGYCIAAAVAEPERLVVAVEGDSGFGFSAMEVETLVRYQLPVVVIVFNNNGVYGGDRRSPDEITGPYKDDPAPTSFVPAAGYHKMMEAFGGKGYLVETPEELKSALSVSFRARKPAVINVIIDPYAGAESGRMQHKN